MKKVKKINISYYEGEQLLTRVFDLTIEGRASANFFVRVLLIDCTPFEVWYE